MDDRELRRYYFARLPLYALTQRHRMPDGPALELEPACAAGAAYLRDCLGGAFTSVPDAEIARRASCVRLWRESDAFAALRPQRHVFIPPSRVEGREHLEAAAAQDRPIVLLTTHGGSFYLAFSALAATGRAVFVLARSVDRSPATPVPVQRFLGFNYWATERRLNGGAYLYTDFAGTLDRRIATVLQRPQTLCVNLLDMPVTLYGGKRHAVDFLGKPALLPINFIRWAAKRQALFLTYWNGFEADFASMRKPRRWLRIDPAIECREPETILQTYADRLGAYVAREPWQWMGLPVAHQFHAGNVAKAA